jgi:hypothetical protein
MGKPLPGHLVRLGWPKLGYHVSCAPHSRKLELALAIRNSWQGRRCADERKVVHHETGLLTITTHLASAICSPWAPSTALVQSETRHPLHRARVWQARIDIAAVYEHPQ